MPINSPRRPALSGILAAAALALTVFSLPAAADDLKFRLSGDMEVPPVTTAAAGNASITVKPDMSVGGKVATTGLAGTMAHIHAGKPGVNGPVIVTLDKDGDNGWMVPAGTKLTEAQYQAYQADGLYINVHSAEHKAGEIRGQMNPPAGAMR